jgi:hypothetical protein
MRHHASPVTFFGIMMVHRVQARLKARPHAEREDAECRDEQSSNDRNN